MRNMFLRLIPAVLLCIAGIASIYYSIVVAAVRSGSKFFLFWDVLGLFFIVLGIGIFTGLFRYLPKWLLITIGSVFLCGVILTSVLVGLIFTTYDEKAAPGLDYILVLGAQMREDGPSVVLQYRLDTAVQYLQDSPDTLCIVSGAQGDNEPCTEAFGMKEYLVSRGISPDRIILEEQAVNTRTNIIYSSKLIPDGSTVGIVTSNFHMYRSLFLCRRFGLNNVSPITAPSTRRYAPNNIIREVCGLMKDRIF